MKVENEHSEYIIHYCWKHKLLPLLPLTTTKGETVEVIDPGLHNQNAGPDFFNAKVKIGGTLWVGNVEIHAKASQWYTHGHDQDDRYNNVILHVVGENDREVSTHDGKVVPQMVLQVPPSVISHYEELLHEDHYPPCYRIIPDLSPLIVHSWMAALQTERLERKTEDITRRVKLCNGSWESAYFVTLARGFGFGVNSDAFETWALNLPLHDVDHHRDNLFQIEALFLGQAGLLEPESVPQRYREQAETEGMITKLRTEYKYLAHKFGLTPMDFKAWRFLRLRPQNFPYIRISQLANLYYQHHTGLSQLLACDTVQDAAKLLQTQATPYWETHYEFGVESKRVHKQVSQASLNLLLINAAVPMLFAYGRHRLDDTLCDRAFDYLEQLKSEDNHVVRMWQDCGLKALNAGDSQALLQLKNEYCDKKDCLRCRIGYEYLKRNK